MNQKSEHSEILTNENGYPTIEQELEKHPDYEVIGNFAEMALDDGAVQTEIETVLIRSWKQRRPAFGTKCNVDGETRYIVFSKPGVSSTDRIIGGFALNHPIPRRF